MEPSVPRGLFSPSFLSVPLVLPPVYALAVLLKTSPESSWHASTVLFSTRRGCFCYTFQQRHEKGRARYPALCPSAVVYSCPGQDTKGTACGPRTPHPPFLRQLSMSQALEPVLGKSAPSLGIVSAESVAQSTEPWALVLQLHGGYGCTKYLLVTLCSGTIC